ncbi:HET domain-containing protein [Pochonia chlamydosporia 170]|uniref:HET domain-containing protein n=1 Tax=Pochonia chlamydosporia 170 TaxID=1380566 RepID=A0A179FVQ5_METCM|nr:HET domain-containing protein [Pochonia chlamydosporia 170]OAQ69735.1 HET domain-containing protein [Pochonia chlamydosporia 170]
MRLLKTNTVEIVEFAHDQIPDYAILSHRWGAEEVTLQEVQQGSAQTRLKQGFKKVQQCCARAKDDGYNYVWVDTCCIDKTSSTELSEAINSMYVWYYQASRCYAFLADVPSRCTTMQESEWFARGWTLQELLAPEEVYFVNEQWADLGTKETLRQEVHDRTGIPLDVLSGEVDVETASVAQRMSWAAKRQTTRPEDRAYCLLGIFGIQMPLLYGEGERAFTRLQEEIMKTSNDHSLFAWASPDGRGGLLATSPAAFEASGRVDQYRAADIPNSPLTVSSRGIDLELRIIGHGPEGLCLAVLNCKQPQQKGNAWEDELVGIWVRDKSLTMTTFERVQSETMPSVDMSKFVTSQCPVRHVCIESGRIKPSRKPRSQNAVATAAITSQMASLQVYDDTLLTDLMSFSETPAKVLVRAAKDGDEDHVWLLLTRTDVEVNERVESGLTALSTAAENGHAAVVNLLLARGASVNSTDTLGRTALHRAAASGQDAIVELLTGVDGTVIDLMDSTGCTPLLLAVQNGHTAAAKVLLDRGSYTYVGDNHGQTTLLFAAANGDVPTATLLLDMEASMLAKSDVNSNLRTLPGGDDRIIDCSDTTGRTPLRVSAETGHEAIMRLLLSRGAQVDAQDTSGQTTLHWAADNGKDAIVELLLTNGGADIHAKDDSGMTALHHAADKGHNSVVTLLLDNAADASARDEHGWTPLWHAASMNHGAIVDMLLESGASISAKDSDGVTPLRWAILQGHSPMAKLLINRGASIDAEENSVRHLMQWAAKNGHDDTLNSLTRLSPDEFQPDSGWTPIIWAAVYGHEALVRQQLTNGVDVNTTDNLGRTVLECAAENGHESIAQLLLDEGADVNQSGEDGSNSLGSTPLSSAANYGHDSVVKLLLERGANPDGTTTKKRDVDNTPLWCATRHRHHKIVKLLLDKGANFKIRGHGRRTLLWEAVSDGDVTTVKLLIDAGANVTEVRDGHTLLWEATSLRDARMVALLLDAGVNVEKGGPSETPLALAYENDCAEVAKVLLERGAKTNFDRSDRYKSREMLDLFRTRDG